VSAPSIISDTSIVPALGGPSWTHRSDRWGSALAYSTAGAALSFALVLPRPLNSFAVAAAFVLGLCGVLIPPAESLERYGDGPAAFSLAVAMVAQVGALLLGITTPATAFPLAAALLLVGSNLAPTRWLGRWQVPLLLLVYFVYAVLGVSESTKFSGPLDAGVDALLIGKNPYAAGTHELPVLLLLGVPARLLGDVRYGLVIATAGAAACLAGARPGRAGAVAAGLLLFLPAQAAAVKDAGAEPFVTLLLGLTVFCACRRPQLFPWVLGLLLTSKTYLVLALPVALLLASLQLNWRDALNMAWKALLAAALVLGPFIAWDPRMFADATLTFGSGSGLAAPNAFPPGVSGPPWLGIAVALAVVALVLWRAARTPSGFAAGVGLTCLGLFAFSPEPVAAQHSLVLAALYFSVGATGLPGTMVAATEMKSFYVQR
jgi:hypothetical protein